MTNIKYAGKSATLVSAMLAASVGTAHAAAANVGDTTITAGGYVKADFIYDFDQDLGDTFFVDGLDGSDPDGGFSFAATESRVNLTSVTDTSMGEITGFIEANFQLANDVDLRHAYLEWNDVLVGQTWTNWMPLTSYHSTVDFHGPVGILFARTPQIRYTVKQGDITFAVSAEQREENESASFNDTTSFIDSDGDTQPNFGSGDDRNVIPDLTARIQYDHEGTHLMASGMVRQIGVDNGSMDEEETGFGVNLSALQPVGPDSVAANFTWGEGIGDYLVSGNTAFYVGPEGLEAIEVMAFTAAYTRNWSERVSSNLVFGYTENDDPQAGTEELSSVHLNTFYSPLPPLTFSGEVMWGDKETFDGSIDEDAVRVQFAAMYSF